jgi:hypothetical protein
MPAWTDGKFKGGRRAANDIAASLDWKQLNAPGAPRFARPSKT